MFDKRLLAMVPEARRYIILNVILQWIALLANIGLFVLIGSFLQKLLEQAVTPDALIMLVVAAACAIALRMACQTGAAIMGQRAAAAAKLAIRQEVYEKLVRLGPSYQEAAATSEAVQVCVEGTEQLESYFGSYLPQLFYAVLAPLTLFAALAPLCLPAAIALLVLVPFIPASIVAVQKIAKRTMGRYWGSYTDLGSLFLESIQGLTTLKIYQADEARHDEMNTEAETFRKATMRLLKMQLNSIVVMDLFAFGGAAVGILVVLSQFATHAVPFAAAFTVIFLSAEFFIPLRTLGSFFHTAMNGMAAADKMFSILDTPEPDAGSSVVNPADTAIALRNVGYSYDDTRRILEGIDIDIPQGSFIGIAGESGSGKSTLAGIIAGAHMRYTGAVTIGGIDLGDISPASLRDTIVRVSHDSYLFKGTLRSNLMLARPGASEEELWDALEEARIAGFVRDSGGLDMPISANGENVSGGQRQRIALARALLRNAAIYLFDEATSNIDAESEEAILQTIEGLAHRHTIIMISHRLRALRNTDHIYVLEKGRLVQTSTHADLVSQDGPYARMWEKQAQLESTIAASHDGGTARPTRISGETLREHDARSIPLRTNGHDTVREHDVQNASQPFHSSDTAPQDDRPDPQFPVSASSEMPKKRSALSIMARLVGLTRPLVPVMIAAAILGVLGFLAAIFLTVFASYGLLSIAAEPASGMDAANITGIGMAGIGTLVALCGIMRGPLRYGEQLCNHYLAFRILAIVRDKVFSALRKLAPAKLEGKDRGNLVSLITSDVELLEVFYAHTLSPAAIALIASLLMVAFIASLSPLLGCVALVSYAIVGIAIPFVSAKMSGTSGRSIRDKIGDMNTFVLDSLRGLKETLQYGQEKQRAAQLKASARSLIRSEAQLKNKTALFMAGTGAVVLACDMAMLLSSAHLAAYGHITFGQALLASAALMSSFGPVIAVANLGSTLQQTLASGARVLDLLDELPQTEEVTDGIELDRFKSASAHRVRFAYRDQVVLSNVDFTIQPGELVHLTGKSGAGKSTLLKLFMRFWDPQQGVVELSGTDIRHIDTSSVRKTESFMTQETHLFTGTIRDNLRIARPDATDEELAEALEKAALSDLIATLPKGIDTQVGELGDTLSGGERQRIGLARIFLHDAPFVLLDEPTSNLDALSEAEVLSALAQNRGNKAIILVSHRSSATAIADRIYSIERDRSS